MTGARAVVRKKCATDSNKSDLEKEQAPEDIRLDSLTGCLGVRRIGIIPKSVH